MSFRINPQNHSLKSNDNSIPPFWTLIVHRLLPRCSIISPNTLTSISGLDPLMLLCTFADLSIEYLHLMSPKCLPVEQESRLPILWFSIEVS